MITQINELTSFANYIHNTRFHQNGLQTPMHRRTQNLIQKKMHQATKKSHYSPTKLNPRFSLFICDEPPQIQLQIMRVDLNLLQPILAERLQSHALHKSLQANLYYPRKNGNLVEFNR